MIEVFKTNINKVSHAETISQILMKHLQLSKIDFDLEDCDKILRIESTHIDIQKVIELIRENDFQCEVLE